LVVVPYKHKIIKKEKKRKRKRKELKIKGHPNMLKILVSKIYSR
jgi:hypothetical protein